MNLIKGLKAVAFDLDGTIYFGDKIASGALELLSILQLRGIRVFYFTNNSSKTRNQIHEKLLRLGIVTDLKAVYSSAYAAAVYAKSLNFKKVFCCGSTNLGEQFLSEGLKVVSSEEVVDAVFIGLDVLFSYQRAVEVSSVIARSKDCKLIACNVDANYPIENGIIMPGCGPIVSFIESYCERKVDYIIGKPGGYMLDLLTKDHFVKRSEIVIVGDSYKSDIVMAKRFGCKSILITQEKLSDVTTVRSIQDLSILLDSQQ